jgi:hypothetical protein
VTADAPHIAVFQDLDAAHSGAVEKLRKAVQTKQ